MGSELPSVKESIDIMSKDNKRNIQYSVIETNGELRYRITRQINHSKQQIVINHYEVFLFIYFLESSYNSLKHDQSLYQKKFKTRVKDYYLYKAVENVYILTIVEHLLNDKTTTYLFDFHESQLEQLIRAIKDSLKTFYSKYLTDVDTIKT